ncbi:MAG: toll/interleukin-1 receptor domain-containing protein [Allosphingosinicella sp.]
MSDIVISYSSKDRDAAERVHDALTEAGYDVFWDREVPPGKDWDSWIRGELEAARLVIVLWTRAGVASPNVRHEAIIAREAGKLLPVIAEDLAPSDFPMGLLHVQALDIGRDSDDFEGVREELLGEIAERLAGKTAPQPEPVRPQRWRRRQWFAPAAAFAAIIIVAVALVLAWPRLSFDPDAPSLSAAELRAAADREVPARGRVMRAATRYLATDSSDLSSSWVWGVAQAIAGAPDEERLLTVRFFQRLETTRQPSCNCYFSYSAPLTIPNAWVVAASARLRRAPPEPLVDVLLNAQSPEGWWAISLDATPDRANAAVHPTALVTIALAEARRAGVVPQPLRARIDDALRRAAAWLNQGPAEGAQWADYPHNAQPTRNLMFAAMASSAARLAGGPADGNAARAFAAAVADLPGIVDTFASGAYVARTNGARYFDDYRHPAAPWIGFAATLAYRDADNATKRRLRPLIRDWFEADLSDPRLPNYEWITGETLFLRALARREIGG